MYYKNELIIPIGQLLESWEPIRQDELRTPLLKARERDRKTPKTASAKEFVKPSTNQRTTGTCCLKSATWSYPHYRWSILSFWWHVLCLKQLLLYSTASASASPRAPCVHVFVHNEIRTGYAGRSYMFNFHVLPISLVLLILFCQTFVICNIN